MYNFLNRVICDLAALRGAFRVRAVALRAAEFWDWHICPCDLW